MTQPYGPDGHYEPTQIGTPSSPGYYYGAQPGYQQQPPPPPPSRGPQILAAAAAVVALIAVVAVVFLFVRSDDDSAPEPAAAGVSVVTEYPQAPQPGENEQAAPEEQQQPAPPPTPAAPAPAPGPVSVAGADRQGFASGPRCNAAEDPAVFIGRTERSRVVVCQVGAQTGRYYYKGYANGNSIEVGYPTRSGSTFTATNKAVSYVVSPSSLTITENGAVLTREPMLQSWVD
ncbi:hypothetical protein [Gordonia caeni]|uniref:Serine/threonine protein kinase n=1 Tax=Gordonia caeni TaxID=1007097 RepID=A0ABP7P813_9ACTN